MNKKITIQKTVYVHYVGDKKIWRIDAMVRLIKVFLKEFQKV